MCVLGFSPLDFNLFILKLLAGWVPWPRGFRGMAKEADSSFAEALANLGLSALLQRLQEQGFQKVEELVYLKVEDVTALLSAEPLLTLRDKRVFENLWETLKQ